MRIGRSLFGCALMLAFAVSVGPTGAGAAPDTPSAEARAAVNRALGYERNRDYRAARVEALNAVRADPAWPTAHIVQARVAIALGDAIAASEAIDAARQSGADPASLRTLSAHAAILRGEPQEALDILSDGPITAGRTAYAARLRAIAYRALGDQAGSAAQRSTRQ